MSSKRNLVVVLVVVVAAAIAAWWWSRPRDGAPVAPVVTRAVSAGPAAAVRPAAIPSARLQITVRRGGGDGGGTAPVPNAAVRLAAQDGEVLVLRAGDDGVATSDALAPGSWRISASAPGHAPAAVTRIVGAGEQAAVVLVLAPGGAPLTGVVSDASGGPIAGARVDAAGLDRRARAGDAVATTLTASDGSYRLDVPTGQVLVAASSPDYAPQSRYVDVGAEGAVADFALVPGAVIEGTVRDEATNQPVAGATVVGRRDRGGVMRLAEGGVLRAVTGSGGRFRFTGLRPGAYELSARHERRSSRAPSRVGVGVADQVTDVELRIAALPVIRGTVVDERGARVPFLEVAAHGERPGITTRAGADGAFELAGLAPGSYLITASGPDHVLDAGTPVALGEVDLDGVRVVVRRGLQVAGRVEPRQVCEVSIAIARMVDDEHPIGLTGELPPIATGADGEFAFSPVSASPFQVSARCPSGDRGVQEGVAAPGAAALVVRVAPSASIAGRVVDGEGKPVSGVTVAAASSGDAETAVVVNGMVTTGLHGVTTGTGAFEIVGLAAGAYQLNVLDGGRPMKLTPRPAPLALAGSDRKSGIELVVERPHGTIRGRVLGADGQPLPDAWVSVHQDVDDMVSGLLSQDDGAPARPQTVSVVGSEGSESGTDGGATTELPPVLTDAQGRFVVTGIPAGAWDVLAEAHAGALRGSARRITPDATVEIQAAPVVRGPRR